MKFFQNSIDRRRPTGLYYLYGDGTCIQSQARRECEEKGVMRITTSPVVGVRLPCSRVVPY